MMLVIGCTSTRRRGGRFVVIFGETKNQQAPLTARLGSARLAYVTRSWLRPWRSAAATARQPSCGSKKLT